MPTNAVFHGGPVDGLNKVVDSDQFGGHPRELVIAVPRKDGKVKHKYKFGKSIKWTAHYYYNGAV